jgi:membrane protein DedA with SNARE-associated domain/membrane-associated phospholipid phosphatase
MIDLFYQLLDWVAQNPLWSGVVIFLVAMSESLAIVGLIVPGVIIMFGIGALIAAGAIEFWSAMAWAVAGAVVGDGLSFWLGRHYRDRLTAMWPFSRYPSSLEQGVAFFNKYGGKSVAFGRFFGPVRAVIPLVAGMLGMSPSRFIAANVISALAWAPAYLIPGIVFGASLELASEVAFRLVMILVLVALLVWISVILVRTVFRLLSPHATALVQGLLRWGEMHPKMGDIAAALADPAHPEAKGLSILASLLIIATGLFALLLGAVLEGTALAQADYAVLQSLQSLRTPWADHMMVYFSQLTDSATVYALAAGVLAFLLWRGHRRTTLYWLAAISFALLASPLLKYGLQIPRPDVVANPPGSYSFPSGHTLKAVVLYGFLSVIITRPIHSRWRWLPYAIASALIAAVAISRLYLGVHWLTDILGSITLGLAWVSLLGIAYHRHAHVETHWRGLSLTVVALLCLTLTVDASVQHEDRIRKYSPVFDTTILNETAWWQDDWRAQPKARLDTRKQKNHPLNIQYSGTLDWIEARLVYTGWHPAQPLDWGNLLKLLSPSISLQDLPVLPQVHDSRHEALLLEKPLQDDRRLVLRLWQSATILSPSGRPLYIGNVTEQEKSQIASIFTFAQTKPRFELPHSLLLKDLATFSPSQLSRQDGLLLIREPATD